MIRIFRSRWWIIGLATACTCGFLAGFLADTNSDPVVAILAMLVMVAAAFAAATTAWMGSTHTNEELFLVQAFAICLFLVIEAASIGMMLSALRPSYFG